MGNTLFQCCEAENSTRLTELTLTPSKHVYTKTTLHEARICNADILPHIRKRAAQASELSSSELSHRIIVLQNILPTAKNLRLKVINTSTLAKGTLLYITPQGLEGSLRFQKDGFTYIGCKKRLNDVIVNDFVIPLKERHLAEMHRGRHFQVSYNIDKDSYWIRDLATGFGVFVKLDYALV